MTLTRKILMTVLILAALAAMHPLLAYGLDSRGERGGFVEGTVAMDVSGGDSLFAGQILGIDAPISGTVRITNTGPLDAALAVTAVTQDSDRLAAALSITVYRETGDTRTAIHAGPVAELTSLPIGTLASGEAATFVLEVSLTSGADLASVASGTSGVGFTWDATTAL